VGGGIGGLTAAIALRRKGVDVEVLEQAPELAAVGASLQLGPNALRLADALGLLPAMRETGVLTPAVELRRWDDDTVLLRTELGPPMEEHFGAPQLDFFRPDLHAVLTRHVPASALRLGARVVRLEQDAAAVSVLLDDGTAVGADAAVAADGLGSPLRNQLTGIDDPVFSGTVVYRGIVPAEDVADLDLPRTNVYWLGPNRHGVSYWLSARRLLAATVAVRDAEWSRESWTLEVPAEEAVAHVEDWSPQLRERLRRSRTMLRGAVYVRPPLDRWAYGRVALLGDAAHAMAPFQAQGAAQAIEDAVVLAACLRSTDEGSVPQALQRYEQIRRPRTTQVQVMSRGRELRNHLPDGPEQQQRDAQFANGDPLRQSAWLYGYDLEADLLGHA